MRFVDSTFIQQTILLDGSQFSGCTFQQCILLFRGQGPVGLDRCQFIHVQWKFEGPAELTLALLAGLWRGGGREFVEAALSGTPAPAPEPSRGN